MVKRYIPMIHDRRAALGMESVLALLLEGEEGLDDERDFLVDPVVASRSGECEFVSVFVVDGAVTEAGSLLLEEF